MIKVVFTYDEEARRWVPTVEGALSHKEGREAFSAVVITCQALRRDLLDRTFVMEMMDDTYTIYPAV